MITPYTVTGTERVRYTATVLANSATEAEVKFLNLIRSKEHSKYTMLVSGIQVQINATKEEE